MKKTIAVAALLISLVAVGCNNDSATPAPTEPAAAVESAVAEEVEAVESAVAEEVEAVESAVAEEVEAVESAVAEASPAS